MEKVTTNGEGMWYDHSSDTESVREPGYLYSPSPPVPPHRTQQAIDRQYDMPFNMAERQFQPHDRRVFQMAERQAFQPPERQTFQQVERQGLCPNFYNPNISWINSVSPARAILILIWFFDFPIVYVRFVLRGSTLSNTSTQQTFLSTLRHSLHPLSMTKLFWPNLVTRMSPLTFSDGTSLHSRLDFVTGEHREIPNKNSVHTSHITFALRHCFCPPIYFNNTLIWRANTVHYLGLYRDKKLVWKPHACRSWNTQK